MKLRSLPIALFFTLVFLALKSVGQKIDRHALVSRHTIVWNDPKGEIPLGNGEFCFNADGTGLQTFGGNTMAHWAWHSFPLPDGINAGMIPSTGTLQQGRNTGLDNFPKDKASQSLRQWMYDNPHSINLARIRFTRKNGIEIKESDVDIIERKYDLWSGQHSSIFMLDGQKVVVKTIVNPEIDQVAFNVESNLLSNHELQVSIDYPYAAIERRVPWVGDFTNSSNHKLSVLKKKKYSAKFRHQMDSTTYYSAINWNKQTIFKADEEKNLINLYASKNSNTITFSCFYSSESLPTKLPGPQLVKGIAAKHWPAFWESGAAIDLSESKDPRWKELERRIVLSQYHMAAQSAGSYPPAEVGLMGQDPWRGQWHMEMLWWHLAHYALWNRWEMAEEALEVYQKFIPSASALASQLGYKGLQWPKSTGPEGRSAPWVGNQVLLWKQPHPIFFAVLDFRLNPTDKTLKKWSEIIEGTATFMADYAEKGEDGKYHLKPVMPPSEQGVTVDDIFDLAYWKWGLEQAQLWREKMGFERNELWDDVIKNLRDLPEENGLYLHSPEWKDTYTERAWEHPNTVGVWGMLPPSPSMDYQTAHRSLLKVLETWDWKRCWGWDFPWTAMAAARLGEPEKAIDALFIDAGIKNHYDERGVCTGGPVPYLPGNGGLLYAMAMMAAGWDGAPEINAPGFPQDGSWVVKWEGLKKAP